MTLRRWQREMPSEPVLSNDLQLSINRALMKRLDEVEQKVEELERKLKGVAASVPVY